MKDRKSGISAIAFSAVTAAAYAVLTIIFAPISYGAVQFRISEALCILPFFLPNTAWGLFVGCAAANIMTGNVFDILFGSVATLLAGLSTAGFGKLGRSTALKAAGCACPVVFNAFIIGAVITKAYSGLDILTHQGVFWLNVLQIAAGEAAVMYIIGLPLMIYLPKRPFFTELLSKAEYRRK